ncbi:hypothetical protein N1851_032963 [Merluccius polli]|uniref:KIAA0513 n=1 Tax=Merluccius polli TaxID=89951 RepID=A0AA47NPZ8_MERPO|nr:hypothetical protein N1851_032963 [Merluccius polli]
MEAVAVSNLIDLPSEAPALPTRDGGHNIFFPDSTFSARAALPEPLVPTGPSAPHRQPQQQPDQRCQEDGESHSDATESADSENDMDPASHRWELRRTSSSSNHSGEEADADTVERREFMKAYVEKIFNGKEDFGQEEKAHFGELCSGENGKGREWFAKYVSAQRCNSKCVSEATFYRLVQSFAVALFECYQMDDYSPAKNLMTMCFTYYHIGRSQLSPSELLEPSGPPVSLDSYLDKANCWLTGRKDAAERLLKTTSKHDVRGFFGGLESKLRGAGGAQDRVRAYYTNYATVSTPYSSLNPEEKKEEKVYLYTHLRQQPIWHTLRFWNAAFFDAVHCERKKRSPTTRERWCHMTQEERDDSSKIDENIAFGQLGTFTHNMLEFGLSKKLCKDFLKKQAIIGNLNEEQNKLLSDHIEKMAAD